MHFNVREMIEGSPALKSLNVVYTDNFTLSEGGALNIYYDLTEEDCSIILASGKKFFVQFPGGLTTTATLKLINDRLLPERPQTLIDISLNAKIKFNDLELLSLIPRCKHISAGTVTSTSQIEKINHYLEPESLSMSADRRVSLKPLKQFTSLKKLTIGGKFKDVETIGEIPWLRQLHFISMNLKDLNFLTPLVNLQELHFGFSGTTNLAALPMIGKIESLSFTWVKKLMMETLLPINDMKYLKHLSFNTIPHLTDLDWLADKNIQIKVEGCKNFRKN